MVFSHEIHHITHWNFHESLFIAAPILSLDPKLISKYIHMAALISNFDIHCCFNLKNFDAA